MFFYGEELAMPKLKTDNLVRHLFEHHGGYRGQVISFVEEASELIVELTKFQQADASIDEEATHVQMSLDSVYYALTGEFRTEGSLQNVYVDGNYKVGFDVLIFSLCHTGRMLLHSLREDKTDAPKDAILVELAYTQKLLDELFEYRHTHPDFMELIVREKEHKHGLLTEGWQ